MGFDFDDSTKHRLQTRAGGDDKTREKTELAARAQVIFFLIFIWTQELQPSRGNLPGVSVKWAGVA